jgi:hypothetical protein
MLIDFKGVLEIRLRSKYPGIVVSFDFVNLQYSKLSRYFTQANEPLPKTSS